MSKERNHQNGKQHIQRILNSNERIAFQNTGVHQRYDHLFDLPCRVIIKNGKDKSLSEEEEKRLTNLLEG